MYRLLFNDRLYSTICFIGGVYGNYHGLGQYSASAQNLQAAQRKGCFVVDLQYSFIRISRVATVQRSVAQHCIDHHQPVRFFGRRAGAFRHRPL